MNGSYVSKIILLVLVTAITSAPTLGQGHKHTHDEPRSIHSGPQVYFESNVIDLGDVHQHERIPGSVTIENHGDADLEIKELAAHCGCTVLQLDEANRIVPPEGKQEITIFFNSEARQGRQRQLINVFTNDPEYPVAELVVKSNVLADFQVLPAQYISLAGAQPGEALESLSVFSTVEGAALDKLEIDVPGRILEYAMESIVNDDGVEGIGVRFNVADEAELGPVDISLRFDGTVNGETRPVWVRAKGIIVGPIEVRPARVESTQPTPRGRSFAPVTLRPADGQAFNVLSIDAGPYIQHSHANGKEPGDVDVSLRLGEEAPDGPLAVSVVVRTDRPDMPIVEIPVFVDVLPRCRVQPAFVLVNRQTMNRSHRIRLQSDIVSALEIQSASCDNPDFEVAVIDASPSYPKIRFVEVRWAGSDAPSQDVVSELKIKTNVPGSEDITVPMEFRID